MSPSSDGTIQNHIDMTTTAFASEERWLRIVAPDVADEARMREVLRYLAVCIGVNARDVADVDMVDMTELVLELRVLYHYEAKKDMAVVAARVREGKMMWEHPSFDEERERMRRLDDFLLQPPDVEEGMLECRRCHSRRTFSFSKQTRRSDESATVFVQCAQCGCNFRL